METEYEFYQCWRCGESCQVGSAHVCATRRTEAIGGPIDKVVDRAMDWVDSKIPMPPPEFGREWSFDACRYRRDSHCYYPETLDAAHTEQAGYPVWFLKDRGHCPRNKWDGPDPAHSQLACPIYDPGLNSKDPQALNSCNRDWDDGGQQDGLPNESDRYA